MSDINFTCPICGNDNPNFIGLRNGKPYCRLCLSFNGKDANYFKPKIKQAKVKLLYSLSDEQNEISEGLIKTYKDGRNSLVHAVCGSGKTEIVLGIIEYAISVGYTVGFAVPRRDVARELHDRIASIFINCNVTLVCGGYNKVLFGDIIVLTTHQLYRFDHYFDLLILDEIDAFPYQNNDILQKFFEKSYRRNYVLLSATPSEKFLKDFKRNGGEVFELFSRFHRHPLPVPKIIKSSNYLIYFSLIKLVKKFQKEDKPLMIFAPTISICEETNNVLRIIFKNGTFVHSKCDDRPKRIQDFRKGIYKYLVTTAVLERGVTIANCQVIIFKSDHKIYDRYSLIQISGRVGRKKDYPEGEVYYVANETTEEMVKSIEEIKRANASLQNMLQTNKS